MSGNLGPQASTKGETTSKTTTKTGYDRLDINKLYKSKTAEPVAKQITQKHGMQTLGKVLPARRAGASIVKPETSNDTSSISVPPTQQQQQPPAGNLGQLGSQQQQKWTNSASHPPGPPLLANMPSAHPPGHHTHDKGWVGGSESGGNYQSQRFAQEFPSLDAGEPTKASSANSNQQHLSGPVPGLQTSKLQDNTYGPGPILRPQTEGSWTQGGGRGGGRPPGPSAQNQPVKEQGSDRPNLGGPTPPPMSLGQGGPAPPPLGYSMQQQYRGMPPFMYPNAGPPPGQGYFPPPGSGMPRYGMPVPPGAPPPSSGPRDSSENSRDSNRGRHPLPPPRPLQQFTVKPILKQEDLKRMDEIDQEGTWASERDDVDYNKRISFSDDDGEERPPQQREPGRKLSDHKNDKERSDPGKPVRILERQISSNEREQHNRYDQPTKEHMSNNELDNEDEWNKRRSNNNSNYDAKDRSVRRGRDSRDEDWRGGNNARFEDDPRGKKGPPTQRLDPRGPQDFGNKQYSNLPPRLQRQQQHNTQPAFAGNQRKTPSPVCGSTAGKDRDRDYQRDRDWEKERGQAPTQYRILERNRGDSESSNTSGRDKRSSVSDQDLRPFEKESMKRSPPSDDSKEKDFDSSKEKDKKYDYKKSDDNKAAFRTSKPGFTSTSSWAEEVEDDDYPNREYEDIKKYSAAPVKPEAIKAEERTVPKRVYIQQRKVENMTMPVSKPESQPEPKKTVEAPKQEKVSEKPRSTAWGEREREGRDKFRGDSEAANLSQEEDRNAEAHSHSSHSSEREIILSEKAQQLIHSKEEPVSDKSVERKISLEEKPVKDYDKRGSKDLDLDKGRDRYGHGHNKSDRRDMGGYSNRGERPRQGGRWGANENRRENKTPERDTGPVNRSHASDTTVSSINNKNPQVELDSNRNIGNERSRGEVTKESSPGSTDKVTVGDGKDKDNLKSNDYDRPRDRDSNDKRYRNNDDSELDNRGMSKNNRGGGGVRERSGHGVYQPRGGWGRQESRGRGRGGGREQYDNRPRKNDYERDDHRNSSKSDRDSDIKKDKVTDKDVVDEAAPKVSSNDEDRIKKDKESGGSGEPYIKASKSSQSNNRNVTQGGGGGTRLQGYQGYGAPSDTPPFSSHSSSKEDEKEKGSEQSAKSAVTPSITGPIPLMDLVDISPPTLPPTRSSGRHHNPGGRGSRGGSVGAERGGMQHRNEAYSTTYNRGGGSKRGRGDAKPLMSISSNELERNDHETGSESGTEEDGKKGQSKGKKDCVTVSGDAAAVKGVSDDVENVESDSQQLSEQSKKGSKEKLGSNSSLKNEKLSAQQQNQAPNKDRKVRNPPYEARPSATNKEVPPRFQRQQQGPPQNQQYPSTKPAELGNNINQKDGPSSNAWENKPVVGNTGNKSEQSVPTPLQPAANDNKDASNDQKLPVSSSSGGSQAISSINSSSILDSSGGPLKTMIFENRNFKSGSVNTTNVTKNSTGVKLNETKKEASLTAAMDIPKEMSQVFGKGASEERSADLDFASAFDDQHNSSHSQVPQSISSQHASTKPLPIGQGSRAYPPHLPSPISPMSMELDKKIKGVSVLWEPPTMPSVAEQTSVSGTDESSFHGTFTSDSHSLKTSDSSNREFSSSLQQPTSYAPGSSPALAAMSAISKPESSTSPNASHIRQVKPQQQQSNMENQNHVTGMSSSPFAFPMSQQHQGNTFGGISAVPSPPTVMYGASQAMHTGPGMYQTFPQHVEASQVMNAGARNQFGQYSNPQGGGGGGPYGLGASIFMTSMDAGYQPMTGFQHSHQQQHSQSGQAQNSRISPGPMTSSGGGANVGGVVMNSSSMKSQQGGGGHPNMPHQHQVMQGGHNQQGYSQMNHHHSGGMGHHQHAVGPVGPNKAPAYTQSGMANQSQPQMYIPYDPSSQPVINLGQNYMSSGIRSAPGPAGPPPPATPPVQNLQPSSTYYSGNASNQVYHTGSNQGGNLQQLHVAVGPNQALQNLQTATQQFGLQFQSPMNLQGYTQQAASTVSALNLGSQLIRQGPPGHSHYNMKQQGIDLQQQQMKSHESMMNQSWNTQGFSVNQGFHGGNKPGGGNVDRNSGNNIGGQRKGSHQSHQMGNLGGMKYVPNSGGGGGYPGHSGQKGGRYSAPGPIQRPVSTSPSTGPSIGSMNSLPPSMSIPIGVKSKHMSHHDSASKHINQPNSLTEEGLLDKLITTEAGQRSISGTPDSSKMTVSGGRLLDDHSSDRNNGTSGSHPNLKNPSLNIAPTNKIGSSDK